jgi:hypothetical protein
LRSCGPTSVPRPRSGCWWVPSSWPRALTDAPLQLRAALPYPTPAHAPAAQGSEGGPGAARVWAALHVQGGARTHIHPTLSRSPATPPTPSLPHCQVERKAVKWLARRCQGESVVGMDALLSLALAALTA